MTGHLKPLSILGIGSVPFREGVNSSAEIFEHWDPPFWPQYPARSLRENFLFQFLGSFPGLKISEKEASFDETLYLQKAREYRRRLECAFSEKIFSDFEPSSEWALGYSALQVWLKKNTLPEKEVIKLQVTGPGTVWASFFSKHVAPENSDSVRSDLIETLKAAGLAQIERVKAHGRSPLIFIDEPLRLSSLGGLSEMVKSFREEGAGVGLHVCSARGWEDLENLKIDLFHFDLGGPPNLSSQDRQFLKGLLKNKKWVAWGIVPTLPSSISEEKDFSNRFFDWLKSISDANLPLATVLRQSLLAPACGTGTLTPEEGEWIREKVREISSLFLKRFRLK